MIILLLVTYGWFVHLMKIKSQVDHYILGYGYTHSMYWLYIAHLKKLKKNISVYRIIFLDVVNLIEVLVELEWEACQYFKHMQSFAFL